MPRKLPREWLRQEPNCSHDGRSAPYLASTAARRRVKGGAKVLQIFTPVDFPFTVRELSAQWEQGAAFRTPRSPVHAEE